MNIGRFSVKNTVFLTILMVSLLILGGISLVRLPREQFAEVPFYWVNIIVPYPGVSAEDVEESVTVQVEKEMESLDSLKQISSVSSEGLSVIRVEFDDGISDDEFARLSRDAQTRFSRLEMPEGTLPALIDEFSSADFLPVIEAVLYGGAPYSLRQEEARLLADKMEAIPDVAAVEIIGEREKQILIETDPQRSEALGISLNEVVRAVRDNTGTFPGGSLGTASRDYLLRTIGEAEAPEDFDDLIIRRGSRQEIVRLTDIADVREVLDPEGAEARFNGEEALILRVTKVPRGNAVNIVAGVKEITEKYNWSNEFGLSIALINDSTIQIKDSIAVLQNNALFGLALLVLILFLFIGLRNALMTALGIPVTFAIAFLLLETLGETFNTNTLFGMVLVLGLIVDHAIVIIENSFRLHQNGLDRRTAAEAGVNQVIKPILAATGTTVAAFLPLMILPGTIGKFLRVIPLTVSIALIASTFEAIFFIPSHFADWPGGKRKKREPGRWFRLLQRGFSRLLDRVYRRRRLAVPLLILIMLASFALVPLLNQDLFSAEDFTLFYIDIEMAPGTPREKTAAVVSEMEDLLLPRIGGTEVSSITGTVGFLSGSSGNSSGDNVAQIVVDLKEAKEGRSRSITAIMDEIQQELIAVPGPEQLLFRKAQNGPPTDQALTLRLEGDNYGEIIEASALLQERLLSYPVLLNIKDDVEAGKPEARILINGERASALGLSARDIGTFIRGSFDGITAATVFRNNEELEVLVKYRQEDPAPFRSLSQIRIPTTDGRLIPLSAVGRLEQAAGVASIKRLNGRREVTITADAYDEQAVPQINSDIEAFFETELAQSYPGVELKVGGEFAELSNLIVQILRLFLIGAFLIYIILGTQFNSFTQPFLILFTVPFAFTGIILYLFLSGTPFSTTVLYAAVALAGIAVNDSIVLISFINELKEAGKKTAEAVKEAAETRLRPIILTSVTTIAGLTPTALGLGGRSVVWGPMATTIIFGLLFSTLTALFFIPALYGLLYDRRREVKSGK